MEKSDRDISQWDARLKEQLERSFHNYHTRRIDLSVARANKQIDWTGEIIIVEKASSSSASATVRLNFDDGDELEIRRNVKIESIFGRLYLTNEVQAGEWLDVIAGINFDYSGIDEDEAQQVLNLTHAVADTNVAAAANPCNRALIKADVNNTQTAWIDFGVAAVQDSCLPLDAGEWVRVKISNTDQINANFEVGGEIVFIVYEV